MSIFGTIKTCLREITEVGLLLAALGIIIQVLFGLDSVQFVGNVTANLTDLIGSLGDQGLVGLIAIGVILHLLSKK
ncbi:MAG TPA: hypothetical protein DHW20_01840 [Gemmatimonadetes bacterium]|nr:hypothetical protein [Gemmatimonadota bacterium]|tara:strand:- start:8546 stop:8773 length:228 start_codon:yes stop_codon:yes gene_type:complete